MAGGVESTPPFMRRGSYPTATSSRPIPDVGSLLTTLPHQPVMLALMNDDHEKSNSNYEAFRECLSGPIIQKAALPNPKPRKRKAHKAGRKSTDQATTPSNSHDERHGSDAEDLADFIDYLATEIFTSLPPDLRTLSHTTLQTSPSLRAHYADPLLSTTLDALLAPLPPSVPDSLVSYALLPDPSSLPTFLAPILTDYIATATAPPPVWSSTRTSHCEICRRDWIPLTYHHLIPRQVHAKALKRGWCDEWRLNSVAWLCRACHSFVHSVAGNEELAREWWSVERLLEREDVRGWAGWVGRVRWKKR